MKILLDIDGVLVTTPGWRPVELHADGFVQFNAKAAKNLARLVDETHAGIVLTTTHRINYSIEEWKGLLQIRGVHASSVTKINEIATLEAMSDRATEIAGWVATYGASESFVIIDDDLLINGLPQAIKERCVLTKSLIGLDEEATARALNILLSQ